MGRSAHKSLRLFVSVEPPRGAREALLGAMKRSCDVSNARLTPVEQVHLTLLFIGETDARKVGRVAMSVGRSVSGLGRFEMTARQLIQLPERGRPRLIAAETDAPADLMELQRRLAHRLARKLQKDSGDRFRPHLTLCRYGKMGLVERFDQPVEIEVGGWEVDRVLLMSSVLTERGAFHREERAFELG